MQIWIKFQVCKSDGQQNQQGQDAANASRLPGQRDVNTELSIQILETDAEWGTTSPRLRDAVIEGASEVIPPDYEKLVGDYFKSVANKGAGQ